MPFKDVSALKASDLFKRMESLQRMGTGKLRRFIEVFDNIVARASRNGASEDEAEARAIPIALTAARSASFVPAGRQAESDVAVFSLFADSMAHGGSADGEFDIDMQFADIEDINDVMAGQAFLGPFSHNRAEAEPQGIIHKVATRDELPDDLKERVDPDIKIVAMASFFDDVPAEERFSSISPEWVSIKQANGSEFHLPTNFITTNQPANPETMGIGRVAAAKVDKERRSLQAQGHPMPDENQNEALEAKVASLEEKATKAEALEKELDGLKSRFAALAGVEDDNTAEVDVTELATKVDSRFASLEAELKKASTELETIREESAKDAAERWASDLFEKKQIAEDSKAKWAAIHIKDPAEAETLADTLPDRALAPGEGRAAASVPEVDDDRAAALLSAIDPRRFKAKAGDA